MAYRKENIRKAIDFLKERYGKGSALPKYIINGFGMPEREFQILYDQTEAKIITDTSGRLRDHFSKLKILRIARGIRAGKRVRSLEDDLDR